MTGLQLKICIFVFLANNWHWRTLVCFLHSVKDFLAKFTHFKKEIRFIRARTFFLFLVFFKFQFWWNVFEVSRSSATTTTWTKSNNLIVTTKGEQISWTNFLKHKLYCCLCHVLYMVHGTWLTQTSIKIEGVGNPAANTLMLAAIG